MTQQDFDYATPAEYAKACAEFDARRAAREANAVQTPWGPAQTTEQLSRTVTRYTTASHGGFHVADVSLALIKPEWRAYAKRWSGSENWFEEDCAWAFVAYTFPGLFTDKEIDAANRTIMWLDSNSKL